MNAPPATPRIGVLLVNTGTPRSPQTADVRRYLAQFLNDPRVIDMHPVGRWLLLNLIILPFRPAKSAHAYRAIWTPRGSPLLCHGEDLATRLQAVLGDGAEVRLAMQFGEPSVPAALDAWASAGIDRVIAVPLFPQFAAASFGSAEAAVLSDAARRWTTPSLQVVPPFWQEPEYLDAVAASIRTVLERDHPDHLLLSYHGVPERHCTRTDTTGQHCLKQDTCCSNLLTANRNCYRAQCMATSRALVQRLGLPEDKVSVAFQSRLGRTRWIQPATDARLLELAKQGVRKLAVAEPSFVADCLETLEEIGIRGREDFRAAGGEDLILVPALNASQTWAEGLAAIIRRSTGWL